MKLKDILAVIVILGVLSIVVISVDRSSDVILYTGPSSLVSDNENNVYINVGTTIYKLNSKGKLVSEVTLEQLGLPNELITDIQTLRSGELIIAIANSGKLYQCNFNTKECNNLKLSGDKLSGIVKIFPDDERNRLYISDGDKHRVLVYDIKGENKLDSTNDPCNISEVVDKHISDNDIIGSLLNLVKREKRLDSTNKSCPLLFQNNIFIANNELIVSDTNNHRIVALDPEDINNELWSASTTNNDSSDRRIWPTNVIKSSDGKLWVINDNDFLKYGDVFLMNTNRVPVKRLALDIEWDPVRMLSRENDILIASAENFDLIKVSLDGNKIEPFGDGYFRDVLKKAKYDSAKFNQWDDLWVWVLLVPLLLLGVVAVVLESRSKKKKRSRLS